MRHKAGLINAVAGPILQGLDTEYKPAGVDGPQPRRRGSKKGFSLASAREQHGDAAAEEALLRKFEKLGPGRVRNAHTSQDSSGG